MSTNTTPPTSHTQAMTIRAVLEMNGRMPSGKSPAMRIPIGGKTTSSDLTISQRTWRR